MTTNRRFRNVLAGCILVALPLSACQQDDFDDVEAINASIAQLNGGLDMEDEAPLFGDASLFTDAEFANETEFSDVFASDTDVVAMLDRSESLRVNMLLRWGQMPMNPDAQTERDWSGRISVNRGAIIVRRSVNFRAERDDEVSTREDRRTVDFRSITKLRSSGLRLTLIDPTPDAEEPFRLEFRSERGVEHTMDVRELLEGPRSVDVGDEGERIVAVAVRRRSEDGDCASGFLRGRWHEVAPNRGRLVGQVINSEGDRIGHMRGVYGERRNGRRVFFGKYITSEGRFRGLFAGRYEDGSFRGIWIQRNGEVGALGGHYRAGRSDRNIGGHYLGRWAANSCNVNVGPGRDMPSRADD